MDPETYRRTYLAPLGEGIRGGKCFEDGNDKPATAAGSEDKTDAAFEHGLPLLPEGAYYTAQPSYRPCNNLTLDLLSADELLLLIEQAGAGHPEAVTGAQLLAWLYQPGLAIADRDRRIAEREAQLASLQAELDAMRGGRAWKLQQALVKARRLAAGMRAALRKRGPGSS